MYMYSGVHVHTWEFPTLGVHVKYFECGVFDLYGFQDTYMYM